MMAGANMRYGVKGAGGQLYLFFRLLLLFLIFFLFFLRFALFFGLLFLICVLPLLFLSLLFLIRLITRVRWFILLLFLNHDINFLSLNVRFFALCSMNYTNFWTEGLFGDSLRTKLENFYSFFLESKLTDTFYLGLAVKIRNFFFLDQVYHRLDRLPFASYI